MPNKGIDGIYEDCCDGKFYDWHLNEIHGAYSIRNGYVCRAPIFYKADEVLTLEEVAYNEVNEELSTFKISKFASSPGRRLHNRPYKIFQLEVDEDLMVLKCKTRPVVIVKGIQCDWRNPFSRFSKLWLCLPIYSYRDRHSQRYVIEDQKLAVPHRFYFPPGIPGLDHEGAGLLNELQFIPENNLTPYKCFRDEDDGGVDRPIRLSEDAFHAMVGHLAELFPDVDITGYSKTRYDFFKELVNEEIPKALRRIAQ
jgi:hypothetical protein